MADWYKPTIRVPLHISSCVDLQRIRDLYHSRACTESPFLKGKACHLSMMSLVIQPDLGDSVIQPDLAAQRNKDMRQWENDAIVITDNGTMNK